MTDKEMSLREYIDSKPLIYKSHRIRKELAELENSIPISKIEELIRMREVKLGGYYETCDYKSANEDFLEDIQKLIDKAKQ